MNKTALEVNVFTSNAVFSFNCCSLVFLSKMVIESSMKLAIRARTKTSPDST
jgi:hypothetical protein